MTEKDTMALYRKYYVDRDYERLDLFQLLSNHYDIQNVLYPGSFVHITPSLVYPVAAYIDSDKQAKKFFSSTQPMDFILKHKQYEEKPTLTFYPQSYTDDLPEENEAYFDLLISQYAGFISQHCKKYLKIGGILLANNSHGDASMASIDEHYTFVGAIMRRNDKYRLIQTNLETYLIPKSGNAVSRQSLEQTNRGVGYTKPASMYLFRRVV
ncbi:MAG: hypothetical protein RLP44_29015 [Aggregatilineales bacterium]